MKTVQNYPQGTAKLAYDTLLPAVVIDDEGYPTDEYLQWIEKFDVFEHDMKSFLSAIFDNWQHGEMGYKLCKTQKGYKALRLHTLGWSGNEDIIQALRANLFFFTLYWVKEERGGHFWFSIPVEMFRNGR
jgi:hypothetical protein